MSKKFIYIAALLALAVAYYLISPLWNVVELNQEFPGGQTSQVQEPAAPTIEQASTDSRVESIEQTPTDPDITDSDITDSTPTTNNITEDTSTKQSKTEQASIEKISSPEPQPLPVQILSQADFVANKHEVQGQALLIQSDEEKILRFENFQTVNGPNLHIYLSADLQAQDYIDLGPILATKGNVNYKLPSNIDYNKYNQVLVWCVPFKVLFSHAQL